jgi:pimeloyl-ACP methyl ester carboxylesterase
MKVEIRGAGPALVYLHPAGGVRWTRVLEQLAEHHTIHMPTFPGFDGTSTESGVDTRKALGARIGDYIEKEIGKPCDVMGCSFGGAVAMWLAIERPDCVDHLVLECPAGLQTIDHPEKVTFNRKPDDVEAQNRRMLTHYGAEDGKDSELLENLSEIKATTLILHGTEDRIIPKESAQLLKTRLQKAFLVYVWDAAHNIEVDQPERMLSVVRSFLERSDAFMVNYA